MRRSSAVPLVLIALAAIAPPAEAGAATVLDQDQARGGPQARTARVSLPIRLAAQVTAIGRRVVVVTLAGDQPVAIRWAWISPRERRRARRLAAGDRVIVVLRVRRNGRLVVRLLPDPTPAPRPDDPPPGYEPPGYDPGDYDPGDYEPGDYEPAEPGTRPGAGR